MKVQTKITLLLLVVVAIFLAGLASIRFYEKAKFRRIAEDRFSERNRSFETFLESYGEPLKTLTVDFTCLDALVQAITTGDQNWLTDNIDDSTLASYQANAVWVYRPDGTLLYTHNNLHTPAPISFQVPAGTFPQIFSRDPLRHFFVKIPQGIMEIRAGTVHPSKDFQRESAPYGYFFAGRLWSKPSEGARAVDSVISEMAMFTGNQIRLVTANDFVEETRRDEENGLVVFSRPLTSWNGVPVARLVISNDSPVIRELNRSSQRLLIALVVFALVLLLLLWASLNLWVRRPLQRIMESLERDDPIPINRLLTEGSEFGALARTVHNSFEQRRDLLREINERRATEEALRKSEEQLRHAQKLEAVGQLAGGIAHDFNNLLTAIIGYSELLASRADNSGLVRQGAELIHKAGKQAAALTQQLLAFSRKQLLQPRVIDLNHLVVEMEQLLQRVIGEHFELVTLPQARIGRVKADPSRLEQVILNLGVNARDAMPRGGRLTIRTSNETLDEMTAREISPSLTPGDYVVLSVADTGDGMSPEIKSHIFEPFFTTKGPGKGTGLGLATVYGIVRQSGGAISVESAPGRGSTFRIYLPLELAPLDEVKPQPVLATRASYAESVLVVEDEKVVRDLVCDLLEEQGYHVICARNGAEALSLAANYKGKIDLLLTDVVMPQMNGHELAGLLTKHRPDIKVLYVSGYSGDDLGEHGILDTAIDLLEKPFTPHSLTRKIREVLSETATPRESRPYHSEVPA